MVARGHWRPICVSHHERPLEYLLKCVSEVPVLLVWGEVQKQPFSEAVLAVLKGLWKPSAAVRIRVGALWLPASPFLLQQLESGPSFLTWGSSQLGPGVIRGMPGHLSYAFA